MNWHPSRDAVLSRLHPKVHGEQIVDKHDLVSAYCIRDLNQDHGLSAHSPQSPKISSADHMLTRQARSPTRHCPELDVAWRFSGVTSGGTWIVNFRRLAASCGEPNFSHLYEMARLGKFRQFRAHCPEWLKRPLLYH